MSPGCGCYQGTYEFAVFEWVSDPPPVLSGDNLAAQPGVTIVDRLSSNPSFPPHNVIDGDPGSSWVGAYWGAFTAVGGRQFYATWGQADIDLGAEFQDYGARVYRPAAGGAQAIAVGFLDRARNELGWFGQSDDTLIGTAGPAFGEASGVLEAPVMARFVRVWMWNPLVPGLMFPALAEIEVFGQIENPTSPDTTPPEVSGVPAGVTAEATGPDGAVVVWPTPSASDDVDGEVNVICEPASGSTSSG